MNKHCKTCSAIGCHKHPIHNQPEQKAKIDTITIDRILRVLPHDFVLICPCGAPMKFDEVVRCMVKCPECGQEHNYHTLEAVRLSEFVEKSLKKLDIE